MSKIPGTNILWSEYECSHCQGLPPFLYVGNGAGEKEFALEYTLLFTAFESIRTQWGSPISISSGYRCPEYQLELYHAGKSTTAYSVHLFGLALDMACKDRDEVEQMVTICRGLPMKPRIGWKKYPSWVHIDLGHIITPRYSDSLREGVEW